MYFLFLCIASCYTKITIGKLIILFQGEISVLRNFNKTAPRQIYKWLQRIALLGFKLRSTLHVFNLESNEVLILRGAGNVTIRHC